MRSRTIEEQYDAPRVEILEVLVEHGFEVSAGNESLGERHEDIEWWKDVVYQCFEWLCRHLQNNGQLGQVCGHHH